MSDWIIMDALENGETAVSAKQGYVELMGYSDATTIISHFVPSTQAYSPNGAFIAPVQEYFEESWEADSPPLRIVERRAIPLTDYNPRVHDTFHLRLGSRWKEYLEQGKEVMAKYGCLPNLDYPGSALDVMNSLIRWTYHPLAGGRGSPVAVRKLLEKAHPIVWSPFMIRTANDAVKQLREPLSVESDVMFLNPMLWLYCVPATWFGTAESSFVPMTKDGHIPLPDEEVWDAGRFGVARLFYLTEQQTIEVYHFSLALNDNKWNMEVRLDVLEIGSQPSLEQHQQNQLKLLRFAASPYLIVKRCRVQRATIRRTRDKFPVASEGVGVILLRRAMYQYSSGEDREGEPVNWSCQWWVSGHWRRQWYPTSQTHKLVYITPYIKGPADKPLKEAVRLMVR